MQIELCGFQIEPLGGARYNITSVEGVSQIKLRIVFEQLPALLLSSRAGRNTRIKSVTC